MSGRAILFLGVALTLAFCVYCLSLAVAPFCEEQNGVSICTSNYQRFLESAPNEKGDTLAGIAGSLAFLWIVITVLLQSKELSLQRNELEQMRRVQEDQTDFLREQNERDLASEVDQEIRVLVRALQNEADSLAFSFFKLVWEYDKDQEKIVWFFGKGSQLPKGDSALVEFGDAIRTARLSVLEKIASFEWSVADTVLPLSWHNCRALADQIHEKAKNASPATQQWLVSDLKLQKFTSELTEAMKEERIWSSTKWGDAI